MKKYIIVLLFSFLLNFFPMIQAESNASKLLFEYEQKFQNKPIIIETRFLQFYSYRYFFVNFIKQSTNKSNYAEMIAILLHKYDNDSFQLIFYDISDYPKKSYSLRDKTKKILYSGELDKEYILFNKPKEIEKIKSGRFTLDYYPLPYLGRKYLGKIKRISDHVYEINKVKVKDGLDVSLNLNELIDASYVVEESGIIETYRDESMGRIIRIIEVGPETIDFADLDTLARIAREKLENYYPLSKETINYEYEDLEDL